MSNLPRNIRIVLAGRRMEESDDRHGYAADFDATFDAGEFSGPAAARSAERDMLRICASLRIRFDHGWSDYLRRQYAYSVDNVTLALEWRD